MIRTLCVAVLVSTVAATLALLAAQTADSQPVHFGIMGGVSIPLGLMRDATQPVGMRERSCASVYLARR